MTKRDILLFLRLVSRRSQVFSCHDDDDVGDVDENAYDGDDNDDGNAVTGERTGQLKLLPLISFPPLPPLLDNA